MGEFDQLLEEVLPPSATILKLQNANNRPAVLLADIDGDRLKELIVAYGLKGETYLLILKKSYKIWYPILEVKGKGYGITDLMAVPLTTQGVNSLIVGWQIGSIGSQLFLLHWKIYGFINLLTSFIVYNKLFAEDMPGKNGKDGQFELAIWIHDIGKANTIEVYRFNGTDLEIAKDVYPYYFKRIATYYKELLSNYDFSYYWYHLADAQLKAEETEQALISINKALKSEMIYPSKEKMMDLKTKILNTQKP